MKEVELRNKIKKKKPKFIRQDAHKKSKLAKNWRKPRGYHAKMRLGKAGKRVTVKTGYGSPKKAKGLTKEGLTPVLITSADTSDINEQGIIISSTIGKKKKLDLLKEAKEKPLKIINIKDIDKAIKEIEDKMVTRKEAKKKREKVKKEKAEKAKPKKKEDLAEKVNEEDKKEKEKKEKDKLLTKRDSN